MKCFKLGFAFLLFLVQAVASAQVVQTEHVKAELLAYTPEAGKLWLGLRLQHIPHWHTYWKNPGDSGEPTHLTWTLPDGATAGPIAWPAPKRLPFGPLLNYGYEGDLLLPVAIDVSRVKTPALDVRLKAEWLVCSESCVPESGEFQLSVPMGGAILANAPLFEAALARQPVKLDAEATARVDAGHLKLQAAGLPSALQGKTLQLFAEEGGVIETAAPVQQAWSGDKLTLTVPISAQQSEFPSSLGVVLRTEGSESAYALRYALPDGWPGHAPEVADVSVASALGLAFLGGLLLNLMPCVFPVLSLKIVSLVSGTRGRGELLAGGVAYTLGVLASFVGLAALLLTLRAAGSSLGWGFQLQSPGFVAVLAVLFLVMALNLLGVFEFRFSLPGNLGGLRLNHPLLDQALTGVLAVLVASPCTAPFMGVALGAALTLPPAQALAVFAALGLGMALPYLLLAAWPRFGALLPRPGAWMVRFKQIMAIPLLATVVWLGVVLWQQLGAANAPHDERWKPWSAETQADQLAAGRPVFVDFTATWCISCQYNKRTVLADKDLLSDMDARGFVYLRADWTRRDAVIAAELRRLGRSGVPVYAIHVPGQDAPKLLSELPSKAEIEAAVSALPKR